MVRPSPVRRPPLCRLGRACPSGGQLEARRSHAPLAPLPSGREPIVRLPTEVGNRTGAAQVAYELVGPRSPPGRKGAEHRSPACHGPKRSVRVHELTNQMERDGHWEPAKRNPGADERLGQSLLRQIREPSGLDDSGTESHRAARISGAPPWPKLTP